MGAMLRQLKTQLDREDTVLSECIREVEEVLEQLSLGVPVQIEFVFEAETYVLAYTKIAGRWRLVLRIPFEDRLVPLSDVSRGRRVAAAMQLLDLVASLPRQLDAMVQERQRAQEVARSVLDQLRGIL